MNKIIFREGSIIRLHSLKALSKRLFLIEHPGLAPGMYKSFGKIQKVGKKITPYNLFEINSEKKTVKYLYYPHWIKEIIKY